MSDEWSEINIGKSAYLRGRIGWQGLRADEFIEEGPYLVTGTDFEDGGVNWSTCYHVSEARFQEGAYIHLRDGDLLITKDGTIGKVAYVRNCPEKAVLNSGVFLLRAKDSAFNHRFLYHVLQSHLFSDFIRQNLAGSTINHLYQYVFERFSFLAPDDDGQARIADVLDSIDDEMRAVQALIAKQERIRAGLLQDLFTRGIDQNGALRPSREEAPDLYHQTELGWLPKGWEVRTLRELSSVITSGSRGWAQHYSVEGAKFIRIGNLTRAHINLRFNDLVLVAPPAGEEGTRTAVQTGDILISITADLGIIGVAPPNLGEAYINQHIALVRTKPNVQPRFVAHALATDLGKIQFDRFNDAGAKAGLNLPTVGRLKVPQPSDDTEANRIAGIVDQTDESIRTLREDALKFSRLKSALMQDLLTGRVSVTPLLQAHAA